MKLVHLSDLHLGKRVNEFNMIEDQTFILRQIMDVIRQEAPDAVLIAGDVYDKPVPSTEAVQLFDDFLCRLAEREVPVFIISGNHDSPDRIAFAARLIARSGVYLSPVYGGAVEPITLRDAFGEVNIYMLPFIKPAHVRRCFPDERIDSYSDALRIAVNSLGMDTGVRNVLLTHQFVTGAERSESEEISVGGADNVDAGVFDGIDYVALGHLHAPQNVGSPRIRYCGTPLKYSFSEAAQEKSVTVAELGPKGSLTVRTVPLLPRRDLREIRGTYMELTARDNYAGTNTDDYMHITLTDEDDIPDAIGKLRVIYPNLMRIDYDNRRTRAGGAVGAAEDVERKTPLELFRELFEKQNNTQMSDAQAAYCADLIEKIWEGKR